MRPDDSGGGLPYPQGDPDAVRSAAGNLRSAASEMTSVTSSTKGAADASLAEWTGTAATSFTELSGAVQGGLAVMEPAYSRAASALDTYAHELETAQRAASRAATAWDEAQTTWNRASSGGSSALDAAASLTGDAKTTAVNAANAALDRAWTAYTTATSAAERQAAQAVTDARNGANAAAAVIRAVASGIHNEIYSKVVEGYGWTGPAFALLGPVGGTAALRDLATTMGDLKDGAYDKFAKFDEAAFKASQDVADEFGPESAEALKSWLSFAQTASAEARSAGIKNVLHELSGAGEDGTAAVRDLPLLDKLGRFGIGVAAVGDVLTLADGKASGTDKGLSAANLVGIGMWAAGTDSGGAVLGAIGIANTADWVPGVGEVIMGGTALFLAGEFAYKHWDQIEAAGKDVVHAAEWLTSEEMKVGGKAVAAAIAAGKVTVNAVEDAGKLTLQVADDGIRIAGTAVKATVHAAETGLKDAGDLAVDGGKDIYDGGKSVLKTIGGWLP